MEFRLVIVTVACLSCLVPPAFSTGLLLKAAAVKGAAVIGAGALAAKGVVAAKAAIAAKGALIAKGAAAVLAAKGAAAIAAKGAALKGAALLAKGAAAKGAALLAAKAAVVKGAAVGGAALLNAKANWLASLHRPLLVRPVVVAKPCPPPTLIPVSAVPVVAPHVPTLTEKLSALITLGQKAAEAKGSALGLLLNALHQKPEVRPPVVYEIVKPPRYYPAPLIEKTNTIYEWE